MNRDIVRLRAGNECMAGSRALLAGVVGISVGAAGAALLDRHAGARRRGEVVQRVIHVGKVAGRFTGKAARDLAHRSQGIAASLASRFRRDHPAPQVLVGRVRARLGRLTSHASAIEVSARNRVVELRGPVLKAEIAQIVRGVARVRGVRAVRDELKRYDPSSRVPGLQGGSRRATPAVLLQRNWTPGVRALVIVCGASLVGRGIRRGGLFGYGTALTGLALGAGGAFNLESRRLLGPGGHRRAVDLRRTITIAAPRKEVFALFEAFENYPKFMSHVRDVRCCDGVRWHWEVEGPLGTTLEWDAQETAFVPNEVIAWKTLPGAAVKSSGIVRFEDDGPATRLDLRLSYTPVAGALGHAFAKLLRSDPVRQIDDDLLRLKSLLESGEAEYVTHQELAP